MEGYGCIKNYSISKFIIRYYEMYYLFTKKNKNYSKLKKKKKDKRIDEIINHPANKMTKKLYETA